MRLWILSALEASPTDALLLAAARKREHDVRLVHPDEVPSEDLPDAVLTRTGASAPAPALDVLRSLEERGVPCVNRSAALRIARDKWLTGLCLDAAGVPIPRTLRVEVNDDFEEALGVLGPAPWYVKPATGTQGRGVARVRSFLELIDAVSGIEGDAIVQQAVEGLEPGDLRVLVLGGDARAAMRRIPAEGEHRANLHRGGSAVAVEPTDEALCCAVEATRALDLDVAGVDLIETAEGPRVLEVNGASGLVGLERTSGLDLSGEVIELVERRRSGALGERSGPELS